MLKFNKLGTFNQDTLTNEIRVAYPASGNAVGCVSITGGLKIIVPEGTLESEVDALLAAHNPSILSSEQTEDANDTTAIDGMLSKAIAGLAQIESDSTALATAASLADAKPIMANILTRQSEIIKALAGIIRRQS